MSSDSDTEYLSSFTGTLPGIRYYEESIKQANFFVFLFQLALDSDDKAVIAAKALLECSEDENEKQKSREIADYVLQDIVGIHARPIWLCQVLIL